jgi:hypothetical protein
MQQAALQVVLWLHRKKLMWHVRMLGWCQLCLVLLWKHCQGTWQASQQQHQVVLLAVLGARRVLLVVLLLLWSRCCRAWLRLLLAAAPPHSMGTGCCLHWRALHCLMVSGLFDQRLHVAIGLLLVVDSCTLCVTEQ